MVIGDKLIGVKADGTVTDTVGKLDKKAKKVATTADDLAVVNAAYAIYQTAAPVEIATLPSKFIKNTSGFFLNYTMPRQKGQSEF